MTFWEFADKNPELIAMTIIIWIPILLAAMAYLGDRK
jgi:hypothetical protein